MKLSELPVADGKLSLMLDHADSHWRVDSKPNDCALAAIAQLLADSGVDCRYCSTRAPSAVNSP